MPSCPKCGKFISEGHYERHLSRCGTPREEQVFSKAQAGVDHGLPDEESHGINWTKLAAYFVIFLLIGSTVVFFVLYLLSHL